MTQEQEEKIDTTKLFISNLDWALTSEGLKEIFARWGEVVDAIVIKDKATGRSKGYGFVKFANEEDAQKALTESEGGEINDRPIRVSFAKIMERTDRPQRAPRDNN